MNFFANLLLRAAQPLPLTARLGLFEVFNLKTVWIAVALMAVNLSCTSAPDSPNSALATPESAQLQAKAAAALAAAEAGSTNGMFSDSTKLQTQAAAPVMIAAADSDASPQGLPNSAQLQAPAAASVEADAAETGSTHEALPAGASPPAMVSGNVSTNEVLTNGMEALDDTYKLLVGDSITFQVTEDEGDPKSLLVEDSGDVEIPYLGRYPAQGKTCKELALELKKELEKKYYYRATVIISVDSMLTHGVVYVIGGVKAPGPMEMPKDDVLTISKAILRAGGFDDFADEKHVRVTRKTDGGTNEVITVNVSQVLDKGQTLKDVPAKPGDLIYVPEKTVRF